MKLNFNDTNVGLFHYELIRGLGSCSSGGAEVEEYMHAVDKIKNGNFASWITEWTMFSGETFLRSRKARIRKTRRKCKKFVLTGE